MYIYMCRLYMYIHTYMYSMYMYIYIHMCVYTCTYMGLPGIAPDHTELLTSPAGRSLPPWASSRQGVPVRGDRADFAGTFWQLQIYPSYSGLHRSESRDGHGSFTGSESNGGRQMREQMRQMRAAAAASVSQQAPAASRFCLEPGTL